MHKVLLDPKEVVVVKVLKDLKVPQVQQEVKVLREP